MKILVMKFGGTSVANLDRIKKIASIIKKETKKYRIVTVLSAMAGVTNNLQNYIDELVVNNSFSNEKQTYFFEKGELKTILDLYAKMVSNGSWKDYGLKISSKQVAFSVFKNSSENAVYNICKDFKPLNKNLKYLITDTKGKILKNSYLLENLLKNINWKKL